MRKNRMSIRNFAKLKKAVLKKKNSAVPIAAHQFTFRIQNVNIADQDYNTKKRHQPVPLFSISSPDRGAGIA